jgi:hypothetical protein
VAIPEHYRWRPVPKGVASRRRPLAALAGAAVAAAGALILGEYDFSGATPYLAGVLFGLVVAEAVLTVARRGTPPLAVAAGLEAAGGLAWAAWISSGRGLAPFPASGVAAAVIGAVVAAGWVAMPSRRRPADRE